MVNLCLTKFGCDRAKVAIREVFGIMCSNLSNNTCSIQRSVECARDLEYNLWQANQITINTPTMSIDSGLATNGKYTYGFIV